MYEGNTRATMMMLLMVLHCSIFACKDSPAPAAKYIWVNFSEDLICHDQITSNSQCFRVRVSLRIKGEEFKEGRLEDPGLPPTLRERAVSRLEGSGMIPVDFDDIAKVEDLQRDLGVAINFIVDSPRIRVELRSCGERVEDMTNEEWIKMSEEMDEETREKFMNLPPTLGYVDDE